MKKLFNILTSIGVAAMFVSCGNNEGDTTEGFKPTLDPKTECSIKVIGDYSNHR